MSNGSKVCNEFPLLRDACRYIVVADEDQAVAGMVIETLLDDGHAVFHAYDGLSAAQLALGLKVCHLVISNTRVGGAAGIDLILDLRELRPRLAMLYLASDERSTPELESQLPADVSVLREPFTAGEPRWARPAVKVRAVRRPSRRS